MIGSTLALLRRFKGRLAVSAPPLHDGLVLVLRRLPLYRRLAERAAVRRQLDELDRLLARGRRDGAWSDELTHRLERWAAELRREASERS